MTQDDHDVFHIMPLSTYVKVFLALLGLTVLTVVVAQLDFGALNTVVAYGIATGKAFLVMAFFMHLKYDSLANKVLVGASLFFLFLLYIIVFIDIATRVKVESTL